MKIIIQSVSERQSGQLEQRFEGDVLRIGRASDQDIRIDEINLPLSIGEITESGGQLILTAKAPKLIRLNGGEVRQQTLKASDQIVICLLYTSPSPRDRQKSRMPSSA